MTLDLSPASWWRRKYFGIAGEDAEKELGKWRVRKKMKKWATVVSISLAD